MAALALAVATGCGGGGGDNGTQAAIATHKSTTTNGSQTSSTRTQAATTGTAKKTKTNSADRQPGKSTNTPNQTVPTRRTIAARYRRFRSCLERHGVRPNSTPQSGGGFEGKQFAKRLERLHSALDACRGELPKSGLPGGFGQGEENPPRPPTERERRQAQEAQQKARQQLQKAQALRSCLAQHGIGSGAAGSPTPAQVRKAFADCEGQLSG